MIVQNEPRSKTKFEPFKMSIEFETPGEMAAFWAFLNISNESVRKAYEGDNLPKCLDDTNSIDSTFDIWRVVDDELTDRGIDPYTAV